MRSGSKRVRTAAPKARRQAFPMRAGISLAADAPAVWEGFPEPRCAPQRARLPAALAPAEQARRVREARPRGPMRPRIERAPRPGGLAFAQGRHCTWAAFATIR